MGSYNIMKFSISMVYLPMGRPHPPIKFSLSKVDLEVFIVKIDCYVALLPLHTPDDFLRSLS